MLLLVTLHSVAIAVYLFEWITNRIRNGAPKKEFAFEYIEDASRPDLKVHKIKLIKC